MAVKLSRSSYDHAKQLIDDGKAVRDERDDWSEHQPSAEEKPLRRDAQLAGVRPLAPRAGRRGERGDEGALQVPVRRLRARSPLRPACGRVKSGPVRLSRHRECGSAPARHDRGVDQGVGLGTRDRRRDRGAGKDRRKARQPPTLMMGGGEHGVRRPASRGRKRGAVRIPSRLTHDGVGVAGRHEHATPVVEDVVEGEDRRLGALRRGTSPR